MGGDTTMQSLLRGGVGDVGGTSEEVAGGSKKGIEGGDNDGEGRDDG